MLATVESLVLTTVESLVLTIIDESFILPHVVTGLPLVVKSDNRIRPAILKW